jgi:hypothetical protein
MYWEARRVEAGGLIRSEKNSSSVMAESPSVRCDTADQTWKERQITDAVSDDGRRIRIVMRGDSTLTIMALPQLINTELLV